MGSARSRVVSCAAVAAILLSAPVATIADTEYRFKGNDDAIKVCRSIINDNVAQLRFACATIQFPSRQHEQASTHLPRIRYVILSRSR